MIPIGSFNIPEGRLTIDFTRCCPKSINLEPDNACLLSSFSASFTPSAEINPSFINLFSLSISTFTFPSFRLSTKVPSKRSEFISIKDVFSPFIFIASVGVNIGFNPKTASCSVDKNFISPSFSFIWFTIVLVYSFSEPIRCC